MRYVLDAPDLVIGGLSIDPILAFGGLLAGLLVGLTGMGGAALVTPMLVLVFGVPPATAVSSDVVASAAMKPVGSWVHIWHVPFIGGWSGGCPSDRFPAY